MTATAMRLGPFTRECLGVVEPWFRDSDTVRYLGGLAWPAAMLARDAKVVGEEFRGAVQTGVYRYLARVDDTPVGYVDCDSAAAASGGR